MIRALVYQYIYIVLKFFIFVLIFNSASLIFSFHILFPPLYSPVVLSITTLNKIWRNVSQKNYLVLKSLPNCLKASHNGDYIHDYLPFQLFKKSHMPFHQTLCRLRVSFWHKSATIRLQIFTWVMWMKLARCLHCCQKLIKTKVWC